MTNKGGRFEDLYSYSGLPLRLQELLRKGVGDDCHRHYRLFDAFRHHLVSPDVNHE